MNAQHEKKDKEKEFLFTTSYDGNIFIWTVEAIEMILSKLDKQDLEENKQKKKAEAKKAYDKVDVLLSILEYDKESELLERKKKEMKNKKTFRYIPVIKFVLNTITMIKEVLKRLTRTNQEKVKYLRCALFLNTLIYSVVVLMEIFMYGI